MPGESGPIVLKLSSTSAEDEPLSRPGRAHMRSSRSKDRAAKWQPAVVVVGVGTLLAAVAVVFVTLSSGRTGNGGVGAVQADPAPHVSASDDAHHDIPAESAPAV